MYDTVQLTDVEFARRYYIDYSASVGVSDLFGDDKVADTLSFSALVEKL